jgi:DNA (cytosine-5)-methyltransferase 1
VRVVAGIDLDPECRFPYEANNSARFLELDSRKVSGDQLRSLWGDGEYSLLAGCAPCQPFSTYGRQKGKEPSSKKKWDLVADFGRLVREASPHLVTMENVPQLIGHAVFADFISSLSGYHVWWDVVDCVRYNVPQTRKRLVLLASRLGPIRLVSSVALIDERGEKPTVRKAIAALKPLQAGETDANDSLHAACRLSKLNLKRIRASSPGGTWRDWNEALVAKCHKKSSGETYPGVYGRMEWDAPAPTITTQSFGYGNGRFGHPEQDRAITLREAAILQTFPGSYRFLPEGEKVRFSVLGRLIGNAVPVQIGEAIANSLFDHLSEHNSQKGTPMKLSPPPNVPGNTEAERMSNALTMVLTVSKKDLLKKEAGLKRASGKKRAKKTT